MDIELIKRQGMIDALSQQIRNSQHYLTNRAWDGTVKSGRYCKLGEAILRAEEELQNMLVLLDEIKKLDPKVT